MSKQAMLRKLAEHLGVERNVDIAKATGLSRPEVTKTLKGERQANMGVVQLLAISAKTGVPTTQLLAWWAGEGTDEEAMQRAARRRPEPSALDRLWLNKLGT